MSTKPDKAREVQPVPRRRCTCFESSNRRDVSFVVWLSAVNREGTVELLNEHEACQTVRQGHSRKRQREMGALQGLFTQSFVATDRKEQIAGLALGLSDENGKLSRAELFSALV